MNAVAPPLVLTDPEQFDEVLIDGDRAVVVRGGARQMQAFERWTDQYLRKAFERIPLIVRFPTGERAKIPSGTFIDYLSGNGSLKSSRGAVYLTDLYLSPSFGEEARATLARDAPFPLARTGHYAEWTSIYAGPAGTFSEIHQDVFSTHTWLALLRGSKRWRLAPPHITDAEIAACRTADIVLDAGDLILLPPDWWHEVENLSSTLAVSGNFCTFEHAIRSRAAASRSSSPNRHTWLQTWEEILRSPLSPS